MVYAKFGYDQIEKVRSIGFLGQIEISLEFASFRKVVYAMHMCSYFVNDEHEK